VDARPKAGQDENHIVGHAASAQLTTGPRGIRAARTQYEVWLGIARRMRWRNPEEVKASHPRASILKGSRVVFNIKGNDLFNVKGNDYRLIAALQYQAGC
jgi:mRNA interferase HigB